MSPSPIANLHLGTSSWSSEDWVGPFYPPGTPPADFLSEYAKHFDAVEADSTFYRSPSLGMVKNWHLRTPPGFKLTAKFPQSVTHEKILASCAAEVKQFLGAMELLGEKLGPLLLQFPYFNKQAFASVDDFLTLLEPFLEQLPRSFSYAVETRNKAWINPRFLEVLRKRHVALALIDHPWMPVISGLMEKQNLVTAEFTYIRWLGNRKGIEEKTKHWDRLIVDRTREMQTWIPVIRQLLKRGVRIFAFFNNHYAGFAPGSIRLFHEVWAQTPEEPSRVEGLSK